MTLTLNDLRRGFYGAGGEAEFLIDATNGVEFTPSLVTIKSDDAGMGDTQPAVTYNTTPELHYAGSPTYGWLHAVGPSVTGNLRMKLAGATVQGSDFYAVSGIPEAYTPHTWPAVVGEGFILPTGADPKPIWLVLDPYFHATLPLMFWKTAPIVVEADDDGAADPVNALGPVSFLDGTALVGPGNLTLAVGTTFNINLRYRRVV